MPSQYLLNVIAELQESKLVRKFTCYKPDVEPCADVILSAAARLVILTSGGGGGAPIDFFGSGGSVS